MVRHWIGEPVFRPFDGKGGRAGGGGDGGGSGWGGAGDGPDGEPGPLDRGGPAPGSRGRDGAAVAAACPVLGRIFPGTRTDPALARDLSGNICANFLGLGNAATPLGISAVKRMVREPGRATDEMCRLIVLNTASIQLIPANVAAVRASLGAASPFDILPAVWIASLCSAGLGVTAAWLMGKVWGHD